MELKVAILIAGALILIMLFRKIQPILAKKIEEQDQSRIKRDRETYLDNAGLVIRSLIGAEASKSIEDSGEREVLPGQDLEFSPLLKESPPKAQTMISQIMRDTTFDPPHEADRQSEMQDILDLAEAKSNLVFSRTIREKELIALSATGLDLSVATPQWQVSIYLRVKNKYFGLRSQRERKFITWVESGMPYGQAIKIIQQEVQEEYDRVCEQAIKTPGYQEWSSPFSLKLLKDNYKDRLFTLRDAKMIYDHQDCLPQELRGKRLLFIGTQLTYFCYSLERLYTEFRYPCLCWTDLGWEIRICRLDRLTENDLFPSIKKCSGGAPTE